MIVGILNQTSSSETRVAATPQTTSQFHKLGFEILIEKNAGLIAGFQDEAYIQAGAVVSSENDILKKSDILLCLNLPKPTELKIIKENSFLIGNLQALSNTLTMSELKKHRINCFALEKLPRLSRAQPFDILSSQNNLSGYRAVIEAVNYSIQAAPMMITSAGTLPPLKFLIIGAGVSGLQAIATAKRIGGKVYASDPREEVKDQIKSLGASYVDDFKTVFMQSDIIITSAFSAGKSAPLLITEAMMKQLPPNAVLIDMAAQYGGNIEGVQNLKTIRIGNKILYGNSNLATHIPHSASILLANNLYNFAEYIYSRDTQTISPDLDDPLISETYITKG